MDNILVRKLIEMLHHSGEHRCRLLCILLCAEIPQYLQQNILGARVFVNTLHALFEHVAHRDSGIPPEPYPPREVEHWQHIDAQR